MRGSPRNESPIRSTLTRSPRSIKRCSTPAERRLRTIGASALSLSRSRSRSRVGSVRAVSTRGSTAADHIGRTMAQLCTGSSAKVQPPAQDERGIRLRTRDDRLIGAIGWVSSQDFPGERLATALQNRFEGVRVRRKHGQLQPISPICDRRNRSAASAWSGRRASIAGRWSGTVSPSRIDGHCPSTLPRFGRCCA